jgi:hypothetical protein
MKTKELTATLILNNWEKKTNDLCNFFIEKYFGKDADTYWIAEEVGSVLYVNDHFFNLNNIIDFLKYKYSKNKMFEWYDYQMDCAYKEESPINIKNYKYARKTNTTNRDSNN